MSRCDRPLSHRLIWQLYSRLDKTIIGERARNVAALPSDLSAGCPDRSARRQGGLEFIVGNSELNFLGIPPSFRAQIFIIHLLLLLDTKCKLIYKKINEMN